MFTIVLKNIAKSLKRSKVIVILTRAVNNYSTDNHYIKSTESLSLGSEDGNDEVFFILKKAVKVEDDSAQRRL